MIRLCEGKIPHNLLKKITHMAGFSHSSIIDGPIAGCDVGTLDVEKAIADIKKFYETNSIPYLTYKSDPITFPTPKPGRYLITVNQNDLATAGSRAYAMTITILLPLGINEEQVLEIQKELHETASSEKISILGGHSEVTSSVKRIILSGSFIGFVPPEYYIGKEASEGDIIISSGWIGAEGTGILIEEGKEKLENFFSKQDLEAGIKIGQELSISSRVLECNWKHHDGITLVHDVTEGGFLAAIYESLEPLGLGARIFGDQLPVSPVTGRLAELLDINPLRLIGSGAVLLYTKPEQANSILNHLEKFDQPAKIIGEVTKEKEILLSGDTVQPPQSDSLIKALKNLKDLVN